MGNTSEANVMWVKYTEMHSSIAFRGFGTFKSIVCWEKSSNVIKQSFFITHIYTTKNDTCHIHDTNETCMKRCRNLERMSVSYWIDRCTVKKNVASQERKGLPWRSHGPRIVTVRKSNREQSRCPADACDIHARALGRQNRDGHLRMLYING